MTMKATQVRIESNGREPLEALILEAEAGLLEGARNLTHETYHDPRCPGLNRSALLQLLRSPRHYQLWKEKADEPTAKMKFGADAHAFILEADTFDLNYAVMPDDEAYQGRSKAAIELRAAFEAKNAGKKVVKKEDFDQMSRIREALLKCPTATSLLDGQKESTMFWIEPTSKLLCRVRPDVHLPNQKTIVDLKITGDASRDGFSKSASQLNYHIQAALYLDAMQADRFLFLCVEDDAPYEIGVYELDPTSIDLGRARYQEALYRYMECSKKGIWPGYSRSPTTVVLPPWKFFEGEDK